VTIALASPRLPVGPEAPGTIDADLIGWAGPKERALHAPRLDRLRVLALSAEFALVGARAIDATIVIVDLDQLSALVAQASAVGLVAVPLSARHVGSEPAEAVRCTVLVTTPQARPTVTGLLTSLNEEGIARGFGFPACCARALAARRGAGVDPMQAMLASADGQVSDAHLLLSALGVGALRHLPCAPDCGPTRAAIDRFLATACSIEPEGGAWLKQLGAWPVTWSSVGGIAEVWTPYFRYNHSTGVGACRVVANPRAARATAPRDPRFGKAMERLLPARTPAPLGALGMPQDWHRAGFDNPFAMRSRYAGLLWQWSAALRGGAGEVLHYPCGDGLLGEMVAEINPRLSFFGVDDDAAAIALARTRLPSLHHHFGLEPHDRDTGGRAAFLDPEPLLSRADRGAQAIRAALARYPLVVIYASDRALRRFGTLASLAHAAALPVEATDETTTSAKVTA
jgi:hypothetical protein